MSRTFVGELSIFLLFIAGSLAGQLFRKNVSLSDGNVLKVQLTDLHQSLPYIQQISIAPNSNAVLDVISFSSSISFSIIQIHTYQYNITLSYDKNDLNKVSNKTVFGSNIGLFFRAKNTTTHFYIKNDNIHKVVALFVVTAYNNQAPVPGGCNMEFNTEIAPYAMVQTRPQIVIVDVQPASMPFNDGEQQNCKHNPVEHEMYQMFLSEQDFSINSYFSAIISMLTVDDIRQNGVQVASSIISSPMRRVFSGYIGVGSVYVAVATYGPYSVAYVPAFSYACNPIVDPDSCEILPDMGSKCVCALCFFVGLLSVFLGHHVLRADIVVPVFFTSIVIGYMILDSIGLSLLIGLFLTVLWYASCFYPFLHKILFNMTTGFFFACVFYYHSPDTFIVLQNDWIFWILFMTLALSISLLMFVFYEISQVITCAIFSSYMMILPIDYYAGSALKYIIINIIRRVIVEDFSLAIIQPPVQAKDVALIVFWTFLALVRFVRQWYRGPGVSSAELTPLL